MLLGTGSDGKIFQVRGGQASVAATTGQMAVSAMVVAWGGSVIAGTFPEGKLFRLRGGQATLRAEAFMTLAGIEDVWSLAFDPKAGVLYAATGPGGKIVSHRRAR